jgi:hypothetical protein
VAGQLEQSSGLRSVLPYDLLQQETIGGLLGERMKPFKAEIGRPNGRSGGGAARGELAAQLKKESGLATSGRSDKGAVLGTFQEAMDFSQLIPGREPRARINDGTTMQERVIHPTST